MLTAFGYSDLISAPPPESPHVAGALAGLKLLDTGDLARYKRAVAACEQIGWSYFFPGLMSVNHPGRRAVLIAEDDGSICVYRWSCRESRQHLDIMLAPMPMNPAVLRRCIERANDFNSDRSARVLRLDEKDAAAVAAVRGLDVREYKHQFLFSPATYASLDGRRLRTIRRNVLRIGALPGVEVAPFGAAHLEPSQDLLRRWGERHREVHGTRGGIRASRRALNLTRAFSDPDLCGEVVLIDGRLVAYAIWGEIRPGVAAFFEAKCETEPAGLSFFHRYNFLSKQVQYRIINDGSDVGRQGLRQLKSSLRPVGMHVECRATQIAQ